MATADFELLVVHSSDDEIQESTEDAPVQTFHCCSSLLDACKQIHWKCAEDLLVDQYKRNDPKALEALVNEAESNGWTALHFAAFYGKKEIVSLLIEYGADGSKQVEDKETPLMVACRWNKREVVQVLLEKIPKSGEVLNLQSENGSTALHFAAFNGYEEIASMLIEHGADESKQDKLEQTPLMIACSGGHKEVVQVLLKKIPKSGEVLNLQSKNGSTALHCAIHACLKGNNKEMVSMLIEHGADKLMSKQDKYKRTPLLLACWRNHSEVVQVLLEKIPEFSKELNLQCENGFTALHYAALHGNEEIVSMLIKHYANGSIQDKHKRTPMMCACIRGHKRIVEMLLKTGSSPVTYEEDTTPTTGWFDDGSYGGSHGAVPGSDSSDKKQTKVSVLVTAINRKEEGIAVAIIDSIWSNREDLEFSIDDHRTGKKVDPLRRAIENGMPAVVERIFQWYTHRATDQEDTNKEDKAKMTFDYTLIDDLAGFKSAETSNKSSGTGEQGSSTSKIQPIPKSRYDTSNHCLNLLINSEKCVKLVRHPLVASLLYQKWTVFAKWTFVLNFFLHLLFTLSLTIFATTVYQPRSEACTAKNSSSTCDTADGHYVSAGIFSGIVLVLSLLRLCFEVLQLVNLWRTYFFDWINYLELLMCIFSVIFVFVYTTECFCPAPWQWQIGTLSVFFAWIDFIHFLRSIPWFGIYVVMFGTIVKNFLRVTFLAVLLTMSFAIPFYMLFYDPILHRDLRTPFQDVGRSFIKTLTMTTGELDYDTLFRQDYTADPSLPYGVSFLFWIAFIALMPILLNNLLTGLAVDDVNKIHENAIIENLCIRADYLQLVEQLLPRWPIDFYRKHREKIEHELKIEIGNFPKKKKFWRGFKWLEDPVNWAERVMWYNTELFSDQPIIQNDALMDTAELLKEVHELRTEVKAMKKKFVSQSNDEVRKLTTEMKQTMKDANVELLNEVRKLITTEIETLKPKVPIPNRTRDSLEDDR